ncbi:MAG: NADH-quinone oxidoreductase subunit J [Planctomycetes bacterium]|nr:NADH-quinone oxidoreductase subunit J [Planctomycetota bacterium]
MDWIGQHWLDWASLLLIAAGVLWLMPGAARRPKVVGVLLALAGTALLATRVDNFSSPIGESVLFWLFAAVAILSAVLMITNRNPVYSALWFAIVTLSTCGLFLLQFAPFLAAATVVIYAGAIVVTFVFVIMLAQQSGATMYDQRSRQPLAATIAAFVMLAAIVGVLQNVGESLRDSNPRPPRRTRPLEASSADVVANPLSGLAADEPLGKMHAIGRSLFGDYLFAVELAGTLLLVATIGAIAIAPRRRRGTL